MAYCTSQQVEYARNQYVVLDAADDDFNSIADTGVIAACIEAGDAELSSYICVRYPDLTPDYSGTIPLVVQHQAARLATATLIERQGGESKLRANVIAWAKLVAAGKVILPGSSAVSLPDSTTYEVEREFGHKQLDDFGETSPRKMSDGDENDPS